jgi:hypothetical protein
MAADSRLQRQRDAEKTNRPHQDIVMRRVPFSLFEATEEGEIAEKRGVLA